MGQIEHRYELPYHWQERLGMTSSRAWLNDRKGPWAAVDFRHTPVRGRAKERLAMELLRRIDFGEGMHPVGNQEHWEQVWGDVRTRFMETGDLDALRPPFVRPFQPVRLGGRFCWMDDPDFEQRWWGCLCRFVFEEWLADCPCVVEYGCGSGHNLAAFAQLAPDKVYYGADFSEEAAKLVSMVGKCRGWRMTGVPADVRKPPWLRMTPGTGVVTVGALEQTGTAWGLFMDNLIEQRPQVVVHVEPIIEWLSGDNLVDYTAKRFMERRGYWSGFPAWLKGEEDAGRVEVLHQHRTGIGSLWIEGYMLNVWRPV